LLNRELAWIHQSHWVFPVWQTHGDASGFAAKEFKGALFGLLQLESLTRRLDGGLVADFRFDGDDVTQLENLLWTLIAIPPTHRQARSHPGGAGMKGGSQPGFWALIVATILSPCLL
jgi:hypothetical protein